MGGKKKGKDAEDSLFKFPGGCQTRKKKEEKGKGRV